MKKWVRSGVNQLFLECYRQLNWMNLKGLSAEQLYFRREIRDSLEKGRKATVAKERF